MNFNYQNNILTVYLDGRIDTTNAEKIEAEVNDIRNANKDGDIILDAEKLEYISSAGLRFILRLKKAEGSLKIVNVSSDIYEIFEMTGFSEMITIEKAYRNMSVEGCTVIGKGAKGTVYRINDDTIIKVYHSTDCLPDIQKERELARKAFVLGVPTAISYDIVKVGDKFGSVFELLNAKSFSQLISENPENIEDYAERFAELLKIIHHTEVKPEDMPDIRIFVNGWLDYIQDYIPEETEKTLRKLLSEVPENNKMLHCDFHTNNVMLQNGDTLLIDMDTLSHGHPVFELANIYITYVGFAEVDPSNVESFLGMKAALAEKFWKAFLPKYLETSDGERLKEVEDKVRIVCYIRLMRHTIRRCGNSETSKNVVEYCLKQYNELLPKIKTLVF